MQKGDLVIHKTLGQCSIRSIDNVTAILKTQDGGMYECSIADIKPIPKIDSTDTPYSSLRTLLRIDASLIDSINNAWGIFSKSNITLLPHQLWVCNRVMRKWPTRMMIADDVGLGKTMEAGLILLAAVSSGRAKRILILTPPSLTKQWQERMRSFSLNFAIYTNTNNSFDISYIIAPISNLKLDRKDKHARLLSAEPWDIVIVDEAHHIGVSDGNATLGFNLIDKMNNAGLISTLLFFTATPHQGKEEDFWGLMSLLDKQIFSKKNPDKYSFLHDYMIRNNKLSIMDMNGKKLFKKLYQHPKTYTYTVEESNFYSMMTDYIQCGYAYASGLDKVTGGQVNLLLIALQKIASSSITAIQNTLKKRLILLEINAKNNNSHIQVDAESGDENIAEKSALKIMDGEIQHIKQLLELAGQVKEESRIKEIIKVISSDYPNEKIVFFTEYKATQALMINALQSNFPNDKTVFINGDNYLDCCGIKEKCDREVAMYSFNEKDAKYLVSTEASGEGVDLQEKCHVLIHVDLPWNPMRLHQRVGRLYRYGQKQDVDVLSFRNPSNLESMIWEKLNEKLENIRNAMDYVMEDPEDWKQMVLGSANESYYSRLFARGTQIKKESLNEWFNQETQTMGNKKALDVVRGIEKNAQRFDLSSLHEVPKLNQYLLFPFLENMLSYNGVKCHGNAENVTFLMPKEWKYGPNIVRSLHGPVSFTFYREKSKESKTSLFAIGDTVCDAAIKQARSFTDNYAEADIDDPLLILKVFDRDTTSNSLSCYSFIAYFDKKDHVEEVKQEDLLKLISGLLDKTVKKECVGRKRVDTNFLETCKMRAINDYKSVGIEYALPELEVFAYIEPLKKGKAIVELW